MYECLDCLLIFKKWKAKCDCGSWSIQEKSQHILETIKININSIKQNYSGYEKLDNFLKLMEKSTFIIAGEPGIGKSTFLTQLAKCFGEKTLYISGEESAESIHNRMIRLNGFSTNSNFLISNTIYLEDIIPLIENYKPKILILDSLFTIQLKDKTKKEILEILELSKKYNLSILIVSHVTKEGIMAGHRSVEHMVDGIFYLEGDRSSQTRIFKSLKNRFSSTEDILVWEMTPNGLQETEYECPEGILFPCIFGKRILMLEIQALVVPTYDYPTIETLGIDKKRVRMIIAILEKYGFNFNQKDIFVNCPKGLKITDTEGDLSIAVALLSALKKKNLSTYAWAGELNLNGKISKPNLLEKRQKYSDILGIKLNVFQNIKEVIDKFF